MPENLKLVSMKIRKINRSWRKSNKFWGLLGYSAIDIILYMCSPAYTQKSQIGHCPLYELCKFEEYQKSVKNSKQPWMWSGAQNDQELFRRKAGSQLVDQSLGHSVTWIMVGRTDTRIDKPEKIMLAAPNVSGAKKT